MSYTGPFPLPALAGGTDQTGTGTDGQLLVASSSGAPAWANITPGSNITITNASNSIEIAASGGSGASTFVTQGSPATVSAGSITINGDGTNITTAGATDVVTITLASSPSVAGSVTAGTGLIATTGNVAITAGNLTFPYTNGAATEGVVTFGAYKYLHCFDPATTAESVFLGRNAGNQSYTTTSNHVGIGQAALNVMTVPTGPNTCIGGLSGSNISTGGFNTCLGYQAGESIASGTYNIFIGDGATGADGNYNIIIGSAIAVAAGSASYNIIINSYFNAIGSSFLAQSNILIGNSGLDTDANTMRLGTTGTGAGNISTTYIGGIYGVTTASSNIAAVLVSDGDQLGTVASSARFKQNIQNMNSDAIMKLRPVNFSFKSDKNNTKQWGLIAEEVAEIMPDIVNYDDEGKPFAVRYHDMPAILLNEIKKLALRIEQLEKRK